MLGTCRGDVGTQVANGALRGSWSSCSLPCCPSSCQPPAAAAVVEGGRHREIRGRGRLGGRDIGAGRRFYRPSGAWTTAAGTSTGYPKKKEHWVV
jgi:hypothetical protein